MCVELVRETSTPLTVTVVGSRDGGTVVRLAGELDIASYRLVEKACRSKFGHAIVVDLAEVTFMDCCGYRGLLSARRTVEDSGGSLTWCNQTGEPAFLLGLLAELEAAG